jgi:hypothetical protein
MFGTRDLNWSGISTLFRSAKMRSPKTPLEAQFFVDRGFGNSRGLTIIHIIERVIGIRQYHPIQSRLQIEIASSDKTVNRVHTLIGFA